MRKMFVFLMVMAASCVSLTGCVGAALGALLPSLATDAALSIVTALIAQVIGGAITPAQ